LNHPVSPPLAARFLTLALGCSLLLATAAPCDPRPPRPLDAAELKLALRKLRVLGSALYVAAHPDDENTALLTWLESERLVRAGYLSLTRGDGGQNLIGSETGALLGVIRTQELLAARRVDGAEQFFTRAVDFGYSKTPEETMRIWGRDSVLADVVRVIRTFRPDVIVTRFPTSGAGGHGHHTASAILAEEAFAAAADPSRFPEQLAALRPWRAKRLVWNVFRFDPAARDSGGTALVVDLGAYNPLLGRSYTEIAGESRSMHKSQGFGAPERRGSIPNRLEHRLGDPAAKDLFDGVELSWNRVPGGNRVDALLAEAERTFDPDRPERILPQLMRAHAAMVAMEADPWIAVKRAELLEVIRTVAGLWVEAIALTPTVAPGEELRVALSALNRSQAPFVLEKIELPAATPGLSPPRELAFNRAVNDTVMVRLPADVPYTQPYWLREQPASGLFHVADPNRIGSAEDLAPLFVRFHLRSGDQQLVLETPVVHRWTDPVAGERYRPLEILPPVGVRLDQGAYVFGGEARPVDVQVKSLSAAASGALRLELPAGWTASPREAPFQLGRNGAEATLRFHVKAAGVSRPPPGRSMVRAVATSGGKSYTHSVVRMDHPHIPIQTVLEPAEARLVTGDIRRAGERIGYVMGSGDQVPDALLQMGYQVTLLTDDEIAIADLSRFDAIVTGVRAYNTRPRLRSLQDRLLAYARQGGTVVVQYNTAEAGLDDRLGPHPFRISRDRVTDETAAMTFVAPTHAVLNQPNKITPADFEGWVQERGLYFASPWDSTAYVTPLASADPGEPPRAGGLLVADVGKGRFVYTGLAFFRQLPAGVPGAYRLFANLVARRSR
jgi:LmbE family N-acetylglucosaminyl deacetylase